MSIVLSLITTGLIQADVKLQTSLDRSIITIGDIVSYKVKLIYTDSITIQPPELASNLGQFEIKDFLNPNPFQNDQNEWVKEYEYRITAFFVGDFIIPPLRFFYTDRQGQMHELKSSEQRLEVKSLITAEDQDIKDIKEPMAIPYNYKPLIIVGLLVLLLIGGLLWYQLYYRKRGGINPELEPEETLSPEEEAYRDLAEIRETYLEDDNHCKEFYIRISYLIRRLIERKYRINALEEITPHILDAVRNQGYLNQDTQVFLRDLLDESDLVKFAKFFQARAHRQTIADKVGQFIAMIEVTLSPSVPMESSPSPAAVEYQPDTIAESPANKDMRSVPNES